MASIFPDLANSIGKLSKQFDQIPSDRRLIIHELIEFVQEKIAVNAPVNLNFICTHNSRRSHVAQIWAQTAAYHFGVEGVACFSGGTEATAFNPRAVKAMKDEGFEISILRENDNPIHKVMYSQKAPEIQVFSKTFDDAVNPKRDFAAILTCSHADKNCPMIPGASKRIALTYDDPKEFDGTWQESDKYRERVQQIGREILDCFSQVKRSLK